MDEAADGRAGFIFLLPQGGTSNPAARLSVDGRWRGIQDLHRKGNASRLYRAGGHCQLEMWTDLTFRPAGLRRATKLNLKISEVAGGPAGPVVPPEDSGMQLHNPA